MKPRREIRSPKAEGRKKAETRKARAESVWNGLVMNPEMPQKRQDELARIGVVP